MPSLDPEDLVTLPEGANHAYLDSEDMEFQGEVLKAFSSRRQIAAQALGNRLLSGRVTREQDGMYDGMFADIVGVLYLCSCPESDVLLSVRRPEKVIEKALAWADSIGIALGTPVFDEALAVYNRILVSLESSQFHVKPGEGSATKNA